MTTRERSMAIFLMALIGLVGGGLAGYVFVYKPFQERKKDIVKLENDILEAKKDSVLAEMQLTKLKEEKRLSLPMDADGGVSLARREYEMQLTTLLRKSKFPAQSISVSPKATEDKTTPRFAEDKKKAIYVKIPVNVVATGTLENIVTFLWYFYRQPLLHSIKSLTIDGAGASINANRRGQQSDKRELSMTLNIEALILDDAEKRQTLMAIPTGPGMIMGGPATYLVGMQALERGTSFYYDKALSTDGREYSHIAWKNIFYGTVAAAEEKPQKDVGPDLTLYIRLNGVFSNSEGVLAATLFDEYSKQDYDIRRQPDGTFGTMSYYYAGELKKAWSFTPTKQFEIGSDDEENKKTFDIIGIDDVGAAVYFREGSKESQKNRAFSSLLLGGPGIVMCPGTVYRLGVGDKVHTALVTDVYSDDGKARERVTRKLTTKEVQKLILDGVIQFPSPDQTKQTRSRPGL